MSRGLESFNAAVEATNLIVPNKDVQIQNFDKISARIIKFGKLNEIKWKGKEGKPDNITQHIRLYLHVYSWFSAESQGYRTNLVNTVITVNPRVAWLPELVALQRSLEEQTGEKEEFFRHKIEILRKDRKMTTGDGRYGYIEVKDDGVDSNFTEGDEESIADVEDSTYNAESEVDRVESKKNIALLFSSCATVEEAYKVMKENHEASTDAEEKDKIIKEYRKSKDRIIGKLIEINKDPIEAAKTYSAKYYAKEPNKHAELAEYAEIVARSHRASEMPTDDLPF